MKRKSVARNKTFVVKEINGVVKVFDSETGEEIHELSNILLEVSTPARVQLVWNDECLTLLRVPFLISILITVSSRVLDSSTAASYRFESH